ncbi:MAG: hypothetical protein FWG53_02155 [Clostridiales bacterium]|nr:hypothetical protein [Clostridiales bacterium]
MESTKAKTQEIIQLYKANFDRIDADERYKWIAVKHFQDKWVADTPNFADMLEQAFAKHVTLLDAGVARTLTIIVLYSKHEPETVRGLYQMLYNETLPLESRVRDFINAAKKHSSSTRNSMHGQYLSITVKKRTTRTIFTRYMPMLRTRTKQKTEACRACSFMQRLTKT